MRRDQLVGELGVSGTWRVLMTSVTDAVQKTVVEQCLIGPVGPRSGACLVRFKRQPRTTKVYLRKMDKRAAMETVRDLFWAAASDDNSSNTENTEFADTWLSSSAGVGAGGFEPP
jgi:hypothetical protein